MIKLEFCFVLMFMLEFSSLQYQIWMSFNFLISKTKVND